MKPSIVPLLLLLQCLQTHSFSSQPIRTPHNNRHHNDPQQQQPQKENFHKSLQKAGKTVFRPGGSRATRILQDEWCQHARSQSFRVLELAAGIGTSGIDWARRRPGCRVLVTDLDAGRMRVAARRIRKRGLAPRVRSSVQDMFQLDLDEADSEAQFDVAMVEAALTHFPRKRKVECLQGLLEHCTSSGELLLHEICFRGVTAGCSDKMTDAKKEIGRSLAIGFHPETAADWKALVEEAGWKVTHLESGAMRLLNPAALWEEEGVKGLCRMAWNLLVHPHLRERLLSTKATLKSHKEDIGYIIVRAVKKKAAEPEQ